MTRILSFVAVLLILSGSYLSCTDIHSEPSKVKEKEWVMDDSLKLFLSEFEEDFMQGLINKRIPGGAVVIVKDGRVILQKGFGVKEKGKPDVVDENTVFRLGSVSKGFASVLAGVVKEEGSLDWNTPVQKVLPDFALNDPAQTKRIEVGHLLSHPTGLPRHAFTNLVEDGLSLDRIIPRLQEVPLIAKEGEQLAYQNAAYSTIEKVLEAQTGMDFNKLLHDKLFEPLEMDQASASYDSIRYSGNTALPHIYHSRAKGRVPVSISKKYYNAVSSGGINASASDMGNWLLMLTGHYPEVISKKTLEEIFEPRARINNKRFSRHWEGVNTSQYGMGWRILDNHGQRVVYHGGYVNGYRSEIAFAPDDDLGICVLINTNSGYPLEVIPGLFNHFKNDPESSTLIEEQN